MTTLTIHDLVESKELDREAMTEIAGGTRMAMMPWFSQWNHVNDVDVEQLFGIATTSSNESLINSAQGNINGNGTQHADQSTYSWQSSGASTGYVGNVSVF